MSLDRYLTSLDLIPLLLWLIATGTVIGVIVVYAWRTVRRVRGWLVPLLWKGGLSYLAYCYIISQDDLLPGGPFIGWLDDFAALTLAFRFCIPDPPKRKVRKKRPVARPLPARTTELAVVEVNGVLVSN